MRRSRAFKQVDVFTSEPMKGNPVAVVLDGDNLEAPLMQQIAAWTNLSETTFVTAAAGAEYHMRIFTPERELPFAGHPSIGTAHALVEAGRVTPAAGRLVQHCGAGPITLQAGTEHGHATLSLRLPPHRISTVQREDWERALGAIGGFLSAPLRIEVGAVWIVAELASAEALAQLRPNLTAVAEISRRDQATGVTVFARLDANGNDIAVRTFAPAAGINEDPVCGSGNGAVGLYRLANGAVKAGRSYLAYQGRALGRDGWVRVSVGENEVFIGGSSVTCIEGRIFA